MSQRLKAVYENGVLKPLEPVSFKEHELLMLTINEQTEQVAGDEFFRYCQSQADDTVSLEAVRAAMAKIPGSMSEVVIEERNER